MSKNVMVTKLVNNELLIGDTENTDDAVIIKKPLQIIIAENQIGLMNFNDNFTDEEQLTVNRNMVLYQYSVKPEVSDGYCRQVSNIHIPDISVQDIVQ